jgi:hypothetical protein
MYVCMTDSLKLLKLQASVWFSDMGKMSVNGDLEWDGIIQGAWRDSENHGNLNQGHQMRFKLGIYKYRELLLPHPERLQMMGIVK